MEADSSLVRTYGIVVLDAVAHIVVHLSFIVYPRHAERDDAVGQTKPLNQIVTFKFGMLVVDILD